MKITRRQFAQTVGVAAVAAGLTWHKKLKDTTPKEGRPQGLTGYPLMLSAGAPRPAWTAAPGDTVHFALTLPTAKKIRLHIESLNRLHVHEFGEVALGTQNFTGERPWLDGAGYAPTVSWDIPRDLPSGVYFLNGLDEIFVIVREPSGRIPTQAHALSTAVLIPTNTINAYSRTRKRSIYPTPIRVPVVSWLRPMEASYLEQWRETTRWVDAEPLFGKPRYLADMDMDDPKVLDGVRLLVVTGHSEYWTRRARENFDRFVAAGGHVIVSSGNMMWWQVRYQEDGRQMVAYKDLNPAYGPDPEPDPLMQTYGWTWKELRYQTAMSIGGDFNRGGYGSRREGLGVKATGLRVIDPHHPLFAGERLKAGAILDFDGVREYDGAPLLGLDARGIPIPDLASLNAHRLELLAYEYTKRGGTTVATAHLYQPRADSGVVLHLSAPEATNNNTPGCAVMRRVSHEFARRVLEGESPFAEKPMPPVAHRFRTPWKGALPDVAVRDPSSA